MSTQDTIARWLCDWDGCTWDRLSARQVIQYGDAAEELLHLIYKQDTP